MFPEYSGKRVDDGYTIAVCHASDLESDTTPGTTYAESLTHQLDTNLLASGLLFRYAYDNI